MLSIKEPQAHRTDRAHWQHLKWLNQSFAIEHLMAGKLALMGGKPVIAKEFTPYLPYDGDEVEAAIAVVKSGVLSQFLGTWHKHFYGGPNVQRFEARWAEFFGCKIA